MTDLDRLWLQALHGVIGRAAHEVKDSLNGVSLNLEVIRSRTHRAAGGGSGGRDGGGSRGAGESGVDNQSLAAFSTAAVEQLELLSQRADAVLFLARQPREPTDVAFTLRQLACLLIPATKADGGRLSVEGYQASALTAASGVATRLALAAGLLALTKNGGSGRCQLQPGTETVVRFSHESAVTCSLEAPIASALAEHSIRTDGSSSDLILVFPGLS